MKKTTILFFFLLLFSSVFSQDNCENAEIVNAGIYSFNEINGSQSAPSNCIGEYENGDAAEWFKYEASQDYTLTITTDLPENSEGDTRFHVYTGTCSDLTCYGGDDDSGSGYLSVETINVFQGETYYIVFDNNWNDDGFLFEIIENEYIEPLLSFTTQPVTPEPNGNTLGAVDMNNDYLDDIISIELNNLNVLYQQADGSFVENNIPTGNATNNPTWSMAIADYDANGYNDLVYGGSNGVTFMKANSDGTSYQEIAGDEYVFSQRTNFIDINNDGYLDAFVCHDIAPNVYYLNDGNGNFTFNQGGIGDSPTGGNYGSIWTDYDNDGDVDVFIAKCRGGDADIKINQLHRNNGDGTFTEVGTESGLADPVQTWSSAWADFNNDGFMDVFVGASSFADGEHKLMQNNGDGTFTDITAGSGFENIVSTGIENVAYDFNNDGYVDVLGMGGEIMINNGDLTFTSSGNFILNGPVGDFNNDGFLDIINNDQIHYNAGNDNNWVKIGLTGVESNINGIGARIEISSDLGTQIRDVKSGVGFKYMNTLNEYFGLGEDTSINEVVVYWPSGIIDEINNSDINSTLIIEEGESLAVANFSYKNISIYPNPTEDYINIESKFEIFNEKFEVFSIQGKIVISGEISSSKKIDVNHLSSGTYFFKLYSKGKTFQRKFIKK
ncbi:FG-GAP-like repeat-containing protein [Mesonia aquimarina]|uniref:FG-GAP-like repeat-containing protein n=1 Tax=Mesonia aquimarina TaxID=1504967 RepID=UPI000EF612D6|nr:FG-GAP-like repeat-containing protein [Mesonia aquimarina]